MKRKLLSLVLIIALVASLTAGCGEAANNATNNNSASNETNNNKSQDSDKNDDDKNNDSEDEEDEGNYPFAFRLAYATDETLAPYSDYATIVADDGEYSSKVLITTSEETLTDLKFYSLEFTDYDQDLNQPIYKETLIGEVNELTPNKPVIFQFTFGEVFATAGFTYVDSKGNTHKIAITMSGLNGNPIPGNIY